MTKEIRISNVKIGGHNPIVLVAGPCVIEDAPSVIRHAQRIKAIARRFGLPFIFKSSYDKANRSPIKSYRGPGLKKALAVLKRVKEELDIPILCDVHCREEIEAAAKVLDVIQVPAFLCRQTDFIIAVARTKKAVNIKKGQFLAPWDMKNVVEKIEAQGNRNILITERGVSFGYNNLVSDMRSLQILRELGYPVIYDATHSTQLPGGAGDCSGGERKFVSGLSRAAVAMGCDGLFLEVHENPDIAPCDGPNMIFLKDLEILLSQVKGIDAVVKSEG